MKQKKMEEGGGREGKQRKRKLRKYRRGGGKQKKQNDKIHLKLVNGKQMQGK